MSQANNLALPRPAQQDNCRLLNPAPGARVEWPKRPRDRVADCTTQFWVTFFCKRSLTA